MRFATHAETFIDIDELLKLEKTEAWQEAADLLHGEFLEGINLDHNLEFETWLLGEQERWRQRAERILTRAVKELEGHGAYRRALRHARKLLHIMPWSEETHRQVMRLLALSGQRSSALKQYETCKRVLWEELGVETTVETTALYERIKQTPRFSMNNIPAETSPIFGRDAELAAISSMLSYPNTRLLTIIGLGGIGKTRLALTVARQHTRGQFRDGVTFVPLSSAESQEQVVLAVARALHLPLTPKDERTPRQQLLDYLKSKQLLIILDNVEQLREGKVLIGAILHSSAGVRILTTSRRPLHLDGEHRFPLQGLDYAAETAGNPAARLFAHAAQRVSPGFSIAGHNGHHVHQICRMVDGIPLALELASGWIDTIPLTAVIEEIETNLDLLSAAEERMPLRHRSMRAVFDGTWRQLRPQTQKLFAALAVFRGSFSREAAVFVADVSPGLLSELVSHSLLEFDLDTERYKVHELLRRYAEDKLSPGDYVDLRHRHLTHYSQAVEKIDLLTEMKAKFAIWEADFNNIQAALDWSLKDDRFTEESLILAGSLEDFWLGSKGHMRQGYVWLNSLIGSDLKTAPISGQARFWRALGRLESLLGHNNNAAHSYCQRSLDLYEEIGDNSGRARTLYYIGEIMQDWNKKTEANNAFTKALEIAVDAGDFKVQAAAKFGLSNLAILSRELDKSQALAQESIELARKIDDRERIANVLATMGMIAEGQQRWTDARAYLLDALRQYQDLGNWGSLHVVFNSLGEIARANGNYEEASDNYRKGLLHSRRQGVELDEMIALFNLGQTELVRGHVRQAIAYINEGWEIAHPYPGEMKALYLEAIANIAASQGDPYNAALLWGAAEALFETYEVHLDTADLIQREQYCAIARSQADESRFENACAGGRRLNLEQAVQFAQTVISSNKAQG